MGQITVFQQILVESHRGLLGENHLTCFIDFGICNVCCYELLYDTQGYGVAWVAWGYDRFFRAL